MCWLVGWSDVQSEIKIKKVSVFVNPYTEMDEEEAEKAKIRPPTQEEEEEKVHTLTLLSIHVDFLMLV